MGRRPTPAHIALVMVEWEQYVHNNNRLAKWIQGTNKLRQRFRPERTGVSAPLGELETEIMRHVWSCGEQGCLASDVQRGLENEHPVAVTTILTTLDRLLQKGIVQREREGKAHRYCAVLTEKELEQRIVSGVLDNLIARFPRAVATYFSQAGGETERLSDLAGRVEKLKREASQPEDSDG